MKNILLKSMMKIYSLPLGLASSILVSIVAFPITAQAQMFPLQNATQSATIRGNNNTINQEINQTIIFQPGTFGSSRWGNRPFSRLKDKKEKFKKSKYNHLKSWKKGHHRGKDKDWKKEWFRDDDNGRKKGRYRDDDDDDKGKKRRRRHHDDD